MSSLTELEECGTAWLNRVALSLGRPGLSLPFCAMPKRFSPSYSYHLTFLSQRQALANYLTPSPSPCACSRHVQLRSFHKAERWGSSKHSQVQG